MENQAWVISVNMGYGHQRTAYPLKDFAYGKQILNANDYPDIPARDRKIWQSSQRFYEAISKFKRVPLIGDIAFTIYDNLFQKIFDFYPRRDLSQVSFLIKPNYNLIHQGWGKDLITRISHHPLPLITTFFIPAFMAEEFNYPNEIYLVVCDADVGRQWVARDSRHSRINYCAPTSRVYERLKLYGVPSERLFLTGYPLPESNISNQNGPEFWEMNIAKHDLSHRLLNLDPFGAYRSKYRPLIEKTLGNLPNANHPLTIMFSTGGAGAQSEIGLNIARQLASHIKNNSLKLILSVGTNQKMRDFYLTAITRLNLDKTTNLEILYEKNIQDYFSRFNKTLRQTDILWTKPSELSFYSALGIPIIIAPPIGSQEDFNKNWLLRSGFGLEQGNIKYIEQWLFDWLKEGFFAEAAMEGFIEGEKMGTYHIKRLITRHGKQN